MRYAFALVLLGCGSKFFPPPVIPSHPSSSDWPDAGAAVLDDVASLTYQVDLGEDGVPPRFYAVLEHRRRLKILSEAGKSAATVELPTDEYSHVSNVAARSVSPLGEVRDMAPEAVAAGPGESPGLGITRFTVPGAEVSGLVDYRYTRIYDDVAFVPPWVFGGPYPVLRAELSLVTDKDVKLDYRFGRGEKLEEMLPLRREDAGRERLVFVLQDLPAYYVEPYMPHPSHVAPWLVVTATQARMPSGNVRLETWEDAASRLEGYFSSLGAEAATGAVASRYRGVRDALHAVSAPGVGVLTPKQKTDAQVSGRDAAGRLLAALKDAGADASPALVTSPRGPIAAGDFPSLSSFLKVVVAVRASGPGADRSACDKPGAGTDPVCRARPTDWILLDPGCRRCRYGELPWSVAGGRAVVLTPSGAQWIDLLPDPPEQHHVSVSYKLAFDSSGKATGTAVGEASGNAGGALRDLLGDLRDEARDQALTRNLFGPDAVPSLTAVDLRNEVNIDQPLGFTAKASGQLDKLGYESFQVRPKNLVGPAYAGDFRATRRYDAVLDAPISVDHIVTLELPVGYDVETKPKIIIGNDLAEFTGTFQRKDRTLVYTQRLRVKTPIVRAQDWAMWKSFLDEVDLAQTTGLKVWVPE